MNGAGAGRFILWVASAIVILASASIASATPSAKLCGRVSPQALAPLLTSAEIDLAMTPFAVDGQDDVLKCRFVAEAVQDNDASRQQSRPTLGEAIIVFIEAASEDNARRSLAALATSATKVSPAGHGEVVTISPSTIAALHGTHLVIANIIAVDGNVRRDAAWAQRLQTLVVQAAGLELPGMDASSSGDETPAEDVALPATLAYLAGVMVFVFLPLCLLWLGQEIAPAHIDTLVELGRVDMPIARVLLHFKVVPAERPPFTRSFGRRVLRRNLHRFAPGSLMPVRFNPLDGTPAPQPVFFHRADYSRSAKLWLIRGFRPWIIGAVAALATVVVLRLG